MQFYVNCEVFSKIKTTEHFGFSNNPYIKSTPRQRPENTEASESDPISEW
jgi:hypothetical protein